MRNISANGLAKLATHQGTEPIFIIEVDWVVGRDPSSYADRDVAGIPGRIIEVGDLVGNNYVVLEGIKPGDKIIVSGVQMLADGMPVVASN